jgi:hypothetical protein
LTTHRDVTDLRATGKRITGGDAEMANEDILEALALAERVERGIGEIYGNIIAFPPGEDYDSFKAVASETLWKDLNRVERLLGNQHPGLSYVYFLRGRLQALKQMPNWNRSMLKCRELYRKAIELGYDEGLTLYYLAAHEASWDDDKEAVQHLERALFVTGNPGLRQDIEEELIRAKAKLASGHSGCFGALFILLGLFRLIRS